MSRPKYFSKSSQPRRSIVTNSEERDLEKALKELEDLEEYCRQVHREQKSCTDKSKATLTAERDAVHVLMAQANNKSLQTRLDTWISSVASKETSNTELTKVIQRTLGEPLKRLGNFYPEAAAAAKKRESLKSDVSKLQNKVSKEETKGRVGVHLARAAEYRCELNRITERFQITHNDLCNDLVALNNARSFYLAPCIKAVIQAHYQHVKEMHQQSVATADAFGEHRDLLLLNADSYEQHMQARMAEIRSLSIVANDELDISEA